MLKQALFSKMRTNALIILLLFLSQHALAQVIIDSCFMSVPPGTDFTSSPDLANNTFIEADLLEWTGTQWIGGWPSVNVTIPPPNGGVGCRALFIGSGTAWTTGGEGFGLRLSSPLIAGQFYSFDISYVSDGVGSDGNFAPAFYTNNAPTISTGTLSGNLPPVGFAWETNTFSFLATAAQTGHNWILIHSGPDGSSGLINSFCSSCQDCSSFPGSFSFGNDVTLCAGQTLSLDAALGNSIYLWQDGSTNPTFTVSQPGTYWVQISNDCGILSDTLNVIYTSPPDPVNLGADTTLCEGASLLLEVTTPNVTCLWQNNAAAPTFNVSQPGTYWVQLSNNCGAVRDSLVVSYETPPHISLGIDLTLCEGSTTLLDATTPHADYLWQDGSSGPTLLVSEEGTYWSQATNLCGTDTDTIRIFYLSPPEVELGQDTILCQGESLLLNATQPGADYLWHDHSNSSTYLVTQPGIYSVVVTNDCGTDNSAINIDFDNCMFCDLYIPNAFSPNRDGINDDFMPVSNCGFENYKLVVFSRWGEQLFETDLPAQGWDGVFRAEELPAGVYVYQVTFQFLDGVVKTKSGSVTLVR